MGLKFGLIKQEKQTARPNQNEKKNTASLNDIKVVLHNIKKLQFYLYTIKCTGLLICHPINNKLILIRSVNKK